MVQNSLPTPLVDVARNVVWFKAPEETLADEVFFLNHVMIYGCAEDIVTTRRHLDDDAFRNALRTAHPGIWDPRSWAYWHIVLDLMPIPPIPIRFPELDAGLHGYGGPPKESQADSLPTTDQQARMAF